MNAGLELKTEVVMQTVKVSRLFGGLAVNQEVDIAIRRGQVGVVLGPNGAGKWTLINLLSGDLACSSGSVLYHGRDITGLTPDARSRIGSGCSYQKTNIFPGFTVLENCGLAAQSRAARRCIVFACARPCALPGDGLPIASRRRPVRVCAAPGQRPVPRRAASA